MTPTKLNVFFAFYPYAGNSTGSSMVWDVTQWFTPLMVQLRTDPRYTERIGEVMFQSFADTPITMTRNKSIVQARRQGADILVMCDSDMRPDVHLGDPRHPDAVPFFETAFDAIYDHYAKGPLVIGAPYGGAPPHENMFVFRWAAMMNGGDESPFELRQYTREEAEALSGIHEAAALPTGLIAYDMRAFDLIDPPWFKYEWGDPTESEKASTEDVQNTRDISLAGIESLGYNPVRAAWSCWAGHLKVWCVGKPQKYSADDVAANLVRAVERNRRTHEGVVDLSTREDTLLDTLRSRQVNRPTPNGEPDHKTPSDHLQAVADLVRVRSKKLGRNIKVAEIGTWKGDMAVAMAETGHCEKIVCVDNFEGCRNDWTFSLVAEKPAKWLQKEWERACANWRKLTELVVGESVASAEKQNDGEFDLIIIDADHSYESTKADILAWLPKLADGGVMIGHDYRTQQHPGVTRAVHELFRTDDVIPFGWSIKNGGFWMVNNAKEAVVSNA